MPRGAPRRHESHPPLTPPIKGGETLSSLPRWEGLREGETYFHNNDKERRNLTFYETVKFGWRINFHTMADMRVNEEQIANIIG